MRKLFISLTILIIFVSSIFSFSFENEKIGKHFSYLLSNSIHDKFTVWIYLTDKGVYSPEKLSAPLNFVSQRSLDRRKKVKPENNLIDITDVPVNEVYVKELIKNVKKIRNCSKWLNAVSAEIDRNQIRNISDLKFVKKIEIVEKYKRDKENIELTMDHPENYNSLLFSNKPVLTDSLNYGTGNAVIQMTQINVNMVHNDGIFGQGILIANFDAGFSNLTHEAFTTYPMKIIATYDFQNHTPVLAGHPHGTATLSAAGAYKPGQMISPAFGSMFALARTEVDPTESPAEMDNWIAAAEWSDSIGVDVITSSLGYLEFDPPYSGYTWSDMNGYTLPITNIADLAVNKGIVVSNSAGNNGSSSHNTLIGPADGDSVITVGAVNSNGSRAGFSSVGPTTDIPPRIKPDIMAMGSSNYLASVNGNNYVNASGTSFSCPINAGVCALILSANKNLTPVQVRNILRKFGSNSDSPDNSLGWGIIDAKRSVDTARKLDNTPPVIVNFPPQNIRINSPVKFRCIVKDNGIIRKRINESPLLYYRIYANSIWSSFSAMNFYKNISDTFYFSIPPVTQKAIVEYYYASQDIALPVPLVSTLPAGGSGIYPPGSIPPALRFSFKINTFTDSQENIPESSFHLSNFPNPFNPATKINYEIPASSGEQNKNYISIVVYDVLGNEVKTLVNESKPAGKYEIIFDGSNLASGVYFYRLAAGNQTIIKQMILLK